MPESPERTGLDGFLAVMTPTPQCVPSPLEWGSCGSLCGCGEGEPGAMEPFFTPHSSHCVGEPQAHWLSLASSRAHCLSEICGTFHLPENQSDSELWGFQITLPVTQSA